MCSGNQEGTLSTQFKGCVDCRRDTRSEGTAVDREGVSGLNRCTEPACRPWAATVHVLEA